MRIPVKRAARGGLPRAPSADPSAAIDADALVSQDGRVRAIRPLTIAIYN